jgi:type IV pilus assembly protein PilB
MSSIHTNDAPSALTRLTDMGVPPYITASAILAVIAQRLARRLCPACKRRVELSEELLLPLGLDATTAAELETYGPVGCDECSSTGYRGRVGVFEIMVMDDELRRVYLRESSSDELRRVAIERGMRTLRDDAMDKLALGLTSAEEIARVSV